jgi:hypothetical protein
MIACFVYILCALTSILCAVLLYRRHRIAHSPLLFWSVWCFVCLALTNVLLFVDLVMFPQVSLLLLRNAISLAGMLMLIYGLVQHRN